MTARVDSNGSVLDRIRQTLVGLRMPRALEVIDATVRRLEQGELSPLEAIEGLLAEELSIRENRRIKTALVMARSRPSRRLPPSTLPSSRRSTATASSPSPSSTSSTAMR